MLDKSALLFIVSLIEEDKFFRVKTKIFPEPEPRLIFKAFVILLDEILFLRVYCWYVIHSLIVWILLTAGGYKLEQTHLAQTHVFLI